MTLYVVNPKAQGALDVPSYATIGAIPAPVDLAVISSPAATVAGILEECGQAGVKAAVIISSGFSEMGNKAGEAEIKAIAARHGIRIIGPNCAGIINTRHRLCPTMETLPPPGPVALISQSGALAGVVLGWAARTGWVSRSSSPTATAPMSTKWICWIIWRRMMRHASLASTSRRLATAVGSWRPRRNARRASR